MASLLPVYPGIHGKLLPLCSPSHYIPSSFRPWQPPLLSRSLLLERILEPGPGLCPKFTLIWSFISYPQKLFKSVFLDLFVQLHCWHCSSGDHLFTCHYFFKSLSHGPEAPLSSDPPIIRCVSGFYPKSSFFPPLHSFSLSAVIISFTGQWKTTCLGQNVGPPD